MKKAIEGLILAGASNRVLWVSDNAGCLSQVFSSNTRLATLGMVKEQQWKQGV